MTPFYRVPLLYEGMMLALYHWHYEGRYRAIADLVPDGASVLEVCSGPGVLFTRFLKHRGVGYTALDVSEPFVSYLRAKGVAAEVWDISDPRPLPAADVVVMQGSLCHFLPDAGPVIRRMLVAARERVIISEPIRSVIHGGNRWLSALVTRLTDPGNGRSGSRFTEEHLRTTLSNHAPRVESSFLIPGGRERVYVLRTGYASGG